MSRPQKYDPITMPNEFVRLSREGSTKAEICATWGISRDTLNRWSKEPQKPELSDAIKEGEAAFEAWAVRELKKMISTGARPGALGALIWLTKNCLGWTDQPGDKKEPIEIPRAVIRLLPSCKCEQGKPDRSQPRVD
jgi:hypothetical protein